MPYAISLADHQALNPTATAPIETVAQNVWIHSGELAAAIATRSPSAMPYSSRST